MSSGNLKISIITVCYNAQESIEQTIQSVITQSYKNIEYIIIDGGSTDDSIKIINKYKSRIHKLISEKDEGIYDAMNKGIQNSTGDIVYFLNSDDRFYDENVIEYVSEIFQHNESWDLVFGKVVPVNIPKDFRPGLEKVYTVNLPFHSKKELLRNQISHQCIFSRKNVFTLTGLLKTEYKMHADFNWVLEAFNKGVKVGFVERYFTVLNLQGLSYQNRNRSLKERYTVVFRNTTLPEFLYYAKERLVKLTICVFMNFKENIVNSRR